MVSSEEFKEALRGGKLEQALLLAMSPAMELKITTQLASDSEQITPSSRLQTRINLIEGKLENEIGEQFLNNAPYRELQQFHLEQVKEGNQTIQQNIGSLQTLFAIVMDIQQHTREGSQPQEEEDLDDTDDWDDSVLDVLQSFPAEAPLQTPTSEAEEPPPSDEIADGELETEEEEQADEILSLEDLEVDAETSSPTEQSQERETQQDWLEPENTRSSQPKEEDTTTSQTQREWEDWSDTDSAEAQEKEWNMEAPKSESVSTDWDDDDEEFSEATEQNRRESGGWSKRLGISWLNPLELFTDWPEDTEAETPQESSDSNAYKDNQNSGG
ncbi:MAG: hypothetical protein BRC50_09870 [Cyanobacteria bacterium SW_11_48_12]|nr:MAG: hypothetical protein BRC50_09870 [Cyanobacteria bacterium SW_11_48_12]